MPRVARPMPVGKLQQAVHEYLHYRSVEADAKKRKAKAYKPIVDHLKASGEEDESTGSLFWNLGEPLAIGGKEITGFQYRRATTELINTGRAQELAREKGVTDRVTHTETIWDYDEFYILNQQGVITDGELDSLLDESESWSLQVETG